MVRTKTLIASILLTAIMSGGLGAGLTYVTMRDDKVGGQTVESEEVAVREPAEEDAQGAIDAQAAADRAERKARASMIRFLERTITKDARKDVSKGFLDGPILETNCTATGGGSTDDLTALTGTFECLAVTEEEPDGIQRGHGYNGTVEWNTGNVTWEIDD